MGFVWTKITSIATSCICTGRITDHKFAQLLTVPSTDIKFADVVSLAVMEQVRVGANRSAFSPTHVDVLYMCAHLVHYVRRDKHHDSIRRRLAVSQILVNLVLHTFLFNCYWLL
jgi:hypothetical protein